MAAASRIQGLLKYVPSKNAVYFVVDEVMTTQEATTSIHGEVQQVPDAPTDKAMNSDEYKRLDDLLRLSKRFYYFAFLASTILLVITTLDAPDEVVIPFINITLPATTATIGLFVAVLVFMIISDRYYRLSSKWLPHDRSRVPHSWLVLSTKQKGQRIRLLWFFPIVLAGFSLAGCLGFNLMSGLGLVGTGAMVVTTPLLIDEYRDLISARRDHRGGSATLSIWLLYIYRLERSITFPAFFCAVLLGGIDEWKETMYTAAFILFFWNIFSFLLRQLAGIPFVYRWIDRLGRRFGFPEKSKHYK